MKKKEFTDIFFKENIFTDFYFFNIGFESCKESHSFGPALRENYIIHFIKKGTGIYKVNNTNYHLKKGDFFVIKPEELTYYEADSNDPWEYYWFGFSGNKASDFLSINGIHSNDYVGHVSNLEDTQNRFNHLMKQDFFDDTFKLSIQASFFELFSIFKIETSIQTLTKHKSKSEKYTESFLLYIQNNYYRRNLTIKEIAKSLYLNPSYFSQIIKENVGMTAQDYLNDYRMNQASRLLKTTSLSIEEIALSVGYDNRHSFSRAFKRKFHSTPTQHKNEE